MKILDARGLSCPAPVIKTRELIQTEQPDIINIMVDNDAARQNLFRFLEYQNYECSFKQEGVDICITAKRNDSCSCHSMEDSFKPDQTVKTLVMITSNRLGLGDDQLGIKLMANFIKTLKEMGNDLWRLVFLNSGVKLTIEGSPALEDLMELESDNLNLLVCGTCLNHFNIMSRKRVGETTNMLDIVTSIQLADKVISF